MELANLKNSKNLLNEKEAAAFLNVSQSTMRNWRQAGKLQYMKIGNVVRYKPQWLESFIEENTREEKELG